MAKYIEGDADLSIDDYAPEAVEYFEAVAAYSDPENDDFEIPLARKEWERIYGKRCVTSPPSDR